MRASDGSRSWTERLESPTVYPRAATHAGTCITVILGSATILTILALVGCRPGASYVAADRMTYEAIAPEYVAYVVSDTTLSSDQRANRLGTVRSWEARLEQAEDAE